MKSIEKNSLGHIKLEILIEESPNTDTNLYPLSKLGFSSETQIFISSVIFIGPEYRRNLAKFSLF